MFCSKHFFLGLFLRSLSTQLFFLVASLLLVLGVSSVMGTSFRDFAEVLFHLSDCILFSTCVGLLPVRLDIKHQVISLLFLCFQPLLSANLSLPSHSTAFFSQFFFDVVLFCLMRCRIGSLAGFFNSGLFFGLPVFRGSVCSHLQGCFHILFSG